MRHIDIAHIGHDRVITSPCGDCIPARTANDEVIAGASRNGIISTAAVRTGRNLEQIDAQHTIVARCPVFTLTQVGDIVSAAQHHVIIVAQRRDGIVAVQICDGGSQAQRHLLNQGDICCNPISLSLAGIRSWREGDNRAARRRIEQNRAVITKDRVATDTRRNRVIAATADDHVSLVTRNTLRIRGNA